MNTIKTTGIRNYNNVHLWLRYNYGRATMCESKTCKSLNPKRYEWALIKGKSYEKIRDNFIQLCPSCHRKYDDRKVSEETKLKISRSKKGIPIGVGKMLSESHKKAISEGMKKRRLNKNNLKL